MKLRVSLYEKGWQFSCHIITGRNVKNILLETVFPHIVLVRKKVQVYMIRGGSSAAT